MYISILNAEANVRYVPVAGTKVRSQQTSQLRQSLLVYQSETIDVYTNGTVTVRGSGGPLVRSLCYGVVHSLKNGISDHLIIRNVSLIRTTDLTYHLRSTILVRYEQLPTSYGSTIGMRCNPLSPRCSGTGSHCCIYSRNSPSNTSPYIAEESTNLTGKVLELFFKAIQFITNECRKGLPGTTNTSLKTLY